MHLFSFRTEDGIYAYVEKKMKFYKETLKKTLMILVQKQEQVAVSNTVSVVKTFTSSCFSGKSWTMKTEAAAVAVENGPTMKSLN